MSTSSYFEFNGINSSTYGILVTGQTVYDIPARDYTQISVPGRNGDVFLDNGTYSNITITYHCELAGTGGKFIESFKAFRKLLAESIGYCKLTDSYDTDHYRRGVLVGGVSVSAIGANWSSGSFDVSFSCEPKRYTVELMYDAYFGYPVCLSGGINDSGKRTQGASCVIIGKMLSSYYRDGAFRNVEKISLSSVDKTSSNTYDIEIVEYDSAGSYLGKTSWAFRKSGDYALKYANCAYFCIVFKNSTIEPKIELSMWYKDGYWSKLIVNKIKFDHNGFYFDYNGDKETSPRISIDTQASLTGSVSITFNETQITAKGITGNVSSIEFDCERQTVYAQIGLDKTLVSSNISLTDATTGTYSYDFPVLKSGENFVGTRTDGGGASEPKFSLYMIYPNKWEV